MNVEEGFRVPLVTLYSLEWMPETKGFALDCKSTFAKFFLRLLGAGWLPVGKTTIYGGNSVGLECLSDTEDAGGSSPSRRTLVGIKSIKE